VSDQRKSETEFDVFVCCADASSADAVSTVAAYLRRHGFRLFLQDRSPAAGPDEGRLALA
jgi:hypothetical protein